MKSTPVIRRAAIHFFVSLAAFMAGWSLQPSKPEDGTTSTEAAAARMRPDQFRATAAWVPKRAQEPDIVSLTKRPGPAGRIAALLVQAESLDARSTLAALKSLDLQLPGTDTRMARQILLARYADLDPGRR
jgi:hypothetical protein